MEAPDITKVHLETRLNRIKSSLAFPLIILLFFAAQARAQTLSIRGKIIDDTNGSVLVGVNIVVENTTIGTVTNENGEFSFTLTETNSATLTFSYVGFETQQISLSKSTDRLLIGLKEQIILGQEVVIAASRIEESILHSPVTIEKMNLSEIRQLSAASFYDGLYALKGVDMVVHGLTFRLPNTRGFNGTTNIRMNQLVDGVDNAPPGLNFAAGNIFGLNPLDIESLELLVGASSALYGPGGMNGTLLMTSKNPFEYSGLSASLQTGMMHVNAGYSNTPKPMMDFNFWYGQPLNKKWAFKISGGYLEAEDWHGSDFRDRTDLSNPNLTRASNPGYDGVNTYGDDIIVPVNLKDIAPAVADGVAQSQGFLPGTTEYDNTYNLVIGIMPDQIISRTGYAEKDLVDYNTKNLRLNGAVHYKLNTNTEAIFQGGYGNGTSVYTATNRFSLRNFEILNGKLELKNKNYYIRTYGLAEFSGDSYDAGATALLMNEAWKPSEQWYNDYIQNFVTLALLGNSENEAHKFARLVADNRDEFGNQFNPNTSAIPVPGTPAFDALFKSITESPVNQGGSKVIDKSKLWHTEGMYNFGDKIKFMEWMIGGSYRLYSINSEGTIFGDTPGNPILIGQFGAFTQLTKRILHEKMKLIASARYDKNEFFKSRTTPRFSIVYSVDNDTDRNIRASIQTAFRFPTIADQWVNLNTGRYQIVGGLPEVQAMHNFNTNPVYPLSGANPIIDKPITDNGPFVIPPFGPESVTSMEFGYKGIHLHKKLLFDGYVYRNTYNGFLAKQTLAQNPNTPQELRYQTTISTDFPMITLGWAMGVDIMISRNYLFRANVNYNTLQTANDLPAGFQSGFNTPNYRFNVSIGNRNFFRDLGFNINWHWQEEFLWQSEFGEAIMPAYATIDASVTKRFSNLHSILKIGASNLMNQYYTTNLGSAQVGGLYYVTWTAEDLLKKRKN